MLNVKYVYLRKKVLALPKCKGNSVEMTIPNGHSGGLNATCH